MNTLLSIPSVTKDELKMPTMESLIKAGSLVVFKDGSYICMISSGIPELKTFNSLGLDQNIWIVVAVNVVVPTPKDVIDSLSVSNNCIVMNAKGDIAFCSRINIRNIKEIGQDEPPYVLKTPEEIAQDKEFKAMIADMEDLFEGHEAYD